MSIDLNNEDSSAEENEEEERKCLSDISNMVALGKSVNILDGGGAMKLSADDIKKMELAADEFIKKEFTALKAAHHSSWTGIQKWRRKSVGNTLLAPEDWSTTLTDLVYGAGLSSTVANKIMARWTKVVRAECKSLTAEFFFNNPVDIGTVLAYEDYVPMVDLVNNDVDEEDKIENEGEATTDKSPRTEGESLVSYALRKLKSPLPMGLVNSLTEATLAALIELGEPPVGRKGGSDRDNKLPTYRGQGSYGAFFVCVAPVLTNSSMPLNQRMHNLSKVLCPGLEFTRQRALRNAQTASSTIGGWALWFLDDLKW